MAAGVIIRRGPITPNSCIQDILGTYSSFSAADEVLIRPPHISLRLKVFHLFPSVLFEHVHVYPQRRQYPQWQQLATKTSDYGAFRVIARLGVRSAALFRKLWHSSLAPVLLSTRLHVPPPIPIARSLHSAFLQFQNVYPIAQRLSGVLTCPMVTTSISAGLLLSTHTLQVSRPFTAQTTTIAILSELTGISLSMSFC